MIKPMVKYCAYLFLLMIIIIFAGCENEYSSLVKKELSKGTRSDSLFMGLYLGMSSKAFYTHCWDMNKKGIFTNGSNNTSVLYQVTKDLKYPAAMNFYPDFYEGNISNMRVSYEYAAWAPWNRNLFADSLLPDVLQMYKKWYPEGNAFIRISDKNKGDIYVKVDGNRRITIGQFDDKLVKAEYTDLLIEEKLKKKHD